MAEDDAGILQVHVQEVFPVNDLISGVCMELDVKEREAQVKP